MTLKCRYRCLGTHQWIINHESRKALPVADIPFISISERTSCLTNLLPLSDVLYHTFFRSQLVFAAEMWRESDLKSFSARFFITVRGKGSKVVWIIHIFVRPVSVVRLSSKCLVSCSAEGSECSHPEESQNHTQSGFDCAYRLNDVMLMITSRLINSTLYGLVSMETNYGLSFFISLPDGADKVLSKKWLVWGLSKYQPEWKRASKGIPFFLIFYRKIRINYMIYWIRVDLELVWRHRILIYCHFPRNQLRSAVSHFNLPPSEPI